MTDRYRSAWRRTLLDMHIPDWDPGMLSQLDAKAIAHAYETAGFGAVMLYCKSHVGLCYWPTQLGGRHTTAATGDFVGELTGLLAERDTPVCAYYSIVYDNWAVTQHPEWSMRIAGGYTLNEVLRYGWCCINNAGYREYELALMSELLQSYSFDALFLDMVFWPIVCHCDCCVLRWREEAAADIPKTVDWSDPAWCSFQAARERWSAQWAQELADTARALCPGIEVTHNLAPSLTDWKTGQSPLAAVADDFVAGDLYGDLANELTAAKMMLHLSAKQPPEFMTSVCVNLGDHVQLKSQEELRGQVLAAHASGAAFAAIDAIDPVGTINSGVYEQLARAFEGLEVYEPYLGGTPVESVGVYFSVDSKLDPLKAPAPVAPGLPEEYPHLERTIAVCRVLQQSHIPFGVITAHDLARLRDYPVVVLSSAIRISAAEATALADYVRSGGRLYASRDTGRFATEGMRQDDFVLAELFGCSYVQDEPGTAIYITPATTRISAAISPQHHISLRPGGGTLAGGQSDTRIPQIRLTTGAAMAMVSEPYAYPSGGTVSDRRWASIHSSPPWMLTERPAIVGHDVGLGRVVYSVADLECHGARSSAQLFAALIEDLVGADGCLRAELPNDVWVSVFDQPGRRVITLFRESEHDRPWTGSLSVRVPSTLTSPTISLVGEGAVTEAQAEAGWVACEVRALDRLVILVVSGASATNG